MSDLQSLPEHVADEENIARVIFSPSMVEDSEISPSAFQLRNLKKPEDYISVFRNDYVELSIENISQILSAPIGNTIYGYAVLNAGVCRKVSYKGIATEVLPHPTQKNPYHAGIHFSKAGSDIKGRCTDPDFIIVTRMLANNSILVQL